MKKIITILLVSLMVLTLTACNKKQEETVVEEPTVQEVVKQEEPKKEETVTPTPEVKEEATVVEEVTKEDTVDVTTLSYWVNFLNYDGSVISRKAYKYGSTPVAPLNPTYEDGVIYYNFLEWDKKVSPVYGTQTYKALYEKTGYVHKDEPNAPAPEITTTAIYHYDGTCSPLYFVASEIKASDKISIRQSADVYLIYNGTRYDGYVDVDDGEYYVTITTLDCPFKWGFLDLVYEDGNIVDNGETLISSVKYKFILNDD